MFEDLNNFLKEQLNSGDPVGAGWFFIYDGRYTFTLTFVYIIFVKFVGPWIMKERKPIQWGRIATFYSFAIVITYVILLYRGVSCVYDQGIGILFYDERKISDHPSLQHGYTTFYYGYLLKYVELLDTVILVTSKKNHMVTVLHVGHHSSLPILGWLYLRTDTSCYMRGYAMVNTIVHIIMYSYYGLSSLGPHVKKYLWWKKYLTQLQIGQFIFMLTYMTFCAYMGWVKSKLVLQLMVIFTLGLILLFLNFYRKSFYRQTGSAIKHFLGNSENNINQNRNKID